MFREFWFQVGVGVTATLIATVAIAVMVPRLTNSGSGSGSQVQTVQEAGAVGSATTAANTLSTTGPNGVTTTASSAGGAPAPAPAPGATAAPATTAATAAAAAAKPAPTTAPPATAAPVVQTAPAPTSAKVPDVKGTTQTNAIATAKTAGFTDVSAVTGCFGGAPGTVAAQTPAAGQTMAFNTPVRLQVEATNCAVIPDVIGLQLQPAADKINAAGFHNIPFQYECLGSANVGAVVTESPAGGTDTTTDTPVTLRLQANNCK
jgi:serine/threonine-protein kinase